MSPAEAPPEVTLRDSIATHLLRRVFVWYLAVAILVTSGYLAYLHYETRQNILYELQLYEETFAGGLELHLWNLEKQQMNAFTKGMLRLPYVVGIAVTEAETGSWFSTAGVYTDAAGQRVGATTPDTPTDDPLITHRFELHHHTPQGEVHLGTATIYSDPALIWRAVRMDYLWVIGAAVIKTLALWLIFLWYSRHHLHRPLHDLTQATARIHLDNLEPIRIDLAGHRRDELWALTSSFNTMLDKLLAARRALEAANADLERTVEERTGELQESRRRLATLIHNLPGIAYRCRNDAEWTMEFISEGCEALTGFPPQAFIDNRETSLGRLILAEDREAVTEAVQHAIDQGRPYQLLYRIAHRDGATRWMWEQGQAIHRADGEVEALEGFISDITERHQAELEAEAARREAERANQSKSRFLANMSHEFRTPMNAVLGFTEVLLRRDPRPDQREYLETVRSGGQNLLRLVDEVLDIARAEAGRIQLEPRPFHLHPLLAECLQMVHPRAETKCVAVRLDAPPELPAALLLDPFRLRQVLLNLLSNAVKFTAVGHVLLRARSTWLNPAHSRVTLVIEVEDTGMGVPPEERERIFEPFEQQSGQSAAEFGGTGLGLAISRQLVWLMGGDLRVDGRPGGGSLFTLTLREVEVPATVPESVTDTTERFHFDPAQVLVADDVVTNRKLLRVWLEEAGLACSEAGNGTEVLRMVADAPPAAILLDLKMPGLDGVEAARRLRARPASAAIPLIAVTAAALPEEVERHRGGFDAYLTKPIAHVTLMETLGRFLPHRKEALAPPSPPLAPSPAEAASAPADSAGGRALPPRFFQEILPRWRQIRKGGTLAEITALCREIAGIAAEQGDPALQAWIEGVQRQCAEASDPSVPRQAIAELGDWLPIPPAGPDLIELRQLTRLGLNSQIQVRAKSFAQRDPSHAAFARELERLARGFDRQALLGYLGLFREATN